MKYRHIYKKHSSNVIKEEKLKGYDFIGQDEYFFNDDEVILYFTKTLNRTKHFVVEDCNDKNMLESMLNYYYEHGYEVDHYNVTMNENIDRFYAIYIFVKNEETKNEN